MPATRMTISDRNAIREAMVAARFAPLFAQIETEKLAHAYAIYNHIYDDKTRRWIQKAPEGALPTVQYLSLRTAGQWHTLSLDQPLRVFDKHESTFCMLDATNPLSEQLDDLLRREKDLKAQRDEVNKQVELALVKFPTFERALKDWPEAETYINARFAVVLGRAPQVPAVLLFDLNNKLGLPPVEAAA